MAQWFLFFLILLLMTLADRWLTLTKQACKLREAAYGQKNYTPSGDLDSIDEGVYYLEHIDDQFRRTYAIKGANTNGVNGVH